jgi:protein-tyrosine phosphatase
VQEGELMNAQRGAVNEIIPGKLYQRGQILTWQREDKLKLIQELKIGVVVNLWTKQDPDMSDMPCWYWYLPSSSQDMLAGKMETMAETLTMILENSGEMSALILCEAGKTRSVYFATLVLMMYENLAGKQALDKINKILGKHSMKDFMLKKLGEYK